MFYSIHAPEIYEKLNYSSMDNSNYKTIITTIYKFGQKNLQIDMATYFWFTSLP